MEPHPQPASDAIEQPAPVHAPPVQEKGDLSSPGADPHPPPYTAPQQPNPPQQPYPPQEAMSNAAPPVTPLHLLGESEAWIDCPFCHRRTRTRVDLMDSSMTMVLGFLLCLICICCACIPCLAHWCADVDHYCTACGKRVTHRPYNGTIEILSENNPTLVPSQYAAGPDLEANVSRPPQAA